MSPTRWYSSGLEPPKSIFLPSFLLTMMEVMWIGEDLYSGKAAWISFFSYL